MKAHRSAHGSRAGAGAGSEAAELIAIKALGFLASDPERLERFLNLTGLSPANVRAAAADPAFLAAVLDHVLADERTLLAFAAAEGLDPAQVGAARARLGPAAPE
jgi:hypothetical protein